MSWTRRSVLLSLLGITVATGGGLTVLRLIRAPRTPEQFVLDLLGRRLAHLDVEPSSLLAFAREHLARAGRAELAELQELAAEDPPRTAAGAAGSLARRQLERRIVARFLLGSDAYQRQDSAAPVRFVAYPDPYEIGCANPLATRNQESA